MIRRKKRFFIFIFILILKIIKISVSFFSNVNICFSAQKKPGKLIFWNWAHVDNITRYFILFLIPGRTTATVGRDSEHRLGTAVGTSQISTDWHLSPKQRCFQRYHSVIWNQNLSSETGTTEKQTVLQQVPIQNVSTAFCATVVPLSNKWCQNTIN